VEAHAHDLRAEVGGELAEKVQRDWRSAGLDSATEALLEFAEKLTRTPAAMTRGDVEDLLRVGHSQRAVADAVQVIGYFNYINRIADGLGVDLEEWMPQKPGPADTGSREEPGEGR